MCPPLCVCCLHFGSSGVVLHFGCGRVLWRLDCEEALFCYLRSLRSGDGAKFLPLPHLCGPKILAWCGIRRPSFVEGQTVPHPPLFCRHMSTEAVLTRSIYPKILACDWRSSVIGAAPIITLSRLTTGAERPFSSRHAANPRPITRFFHMIESVPLCSTPPLVESLMYQR